MTRFRCGRPRGAAPFGRRSQRPAPGARSAGGRWGLDQAQQAV